MHAMPAQDVDATIADAVSRRMPASALAADAVTPYTGTVVNRADFGVFVDFGCERNGLLPARGAYGSDPEVLAQLQVGDVITVYVSARLEGRLRGWVGQFFGGQQRRKDRRARSCAFSIGCILAADAAEQRS